MIRALLLLAWDLAAGRIRLAFPHLCEGCAAWHTWISPAQRDEHVRTRVMRCRCGGELHPINQERWPL